MQSRQMSREGSVNQTDLEATLIQVVNHHRHDWMNDLQVLLGYIQLNKQDKLRGYLDKLLDKLYRESLVSKLGNERLIAYLITFRAKNRSLALTVHPERDINLKLLGEYGDCAAESIVSIVEAYSVAARFGNGDSNELLLSMDFIDDGKSGNCELVIAFEYTGEYHPELLLQGVKNVIERYHKDERGSASCELIEKAADIELRQLIDWTKRGERSCS